MPVIRALGASVKVDPGDSIDLGEFERAWSRCLDPRAETAADDAPTVPAASSMTALTQQVTRALIAQRRGELLMLHAGAVSHPRSGYSIAYVAPGGTGKTTLTRLLGQRYGYLTDETVGVDPSSYRIHPYEKPLSLRTAEGGFPKVERGPDELGLQPAHHDPRLAALVLLRREAGREEARITRLDLFDAVTALVPETSSLSRLHRPLHLLARLYDDLGGFWLAEYSDAGTLVSWVETQLGEP